MKFKKYLFIIPIFIIISFLQLSAKENSQKSQKKILSADLTATSYDWGHRRIDRPGVFDVPPYPGEISIWNTGTEDITINNINIVSQTHGEAFEFDRSQLENLVIQTGSMFYLLVNFHPVNACLHELVFTYDTDAGTMATTSLRGFGTVPQIKISDCNFHSAIVGDYSNPNIGKVTITNLPLSEWECGDAVTISDLLVQNNGNEIATEIVGNVYGSKGFRFDKAAIGLPVVLQPGDSISFDAYFVAPYFNASTAELKTKSDAQEDFISHWIGVGLNTGISIMGDSKTICSGSTAQLNCFIINTDVNPILIDSIRLEPPVYELTFDNPIDTYGGYTISPGALKMIYLHYRPITIGNHNTKLVVYNSSLLQPVAQADLLCQSVHFTRATKIEPDEQYVKSGKEIAVSLMLEPGDDISSAGARNLDIEISYNPNILKVVKSALKTGSQLEGKFSYWNFTIDDSLGIMSLRLGGDEIYNFPAGCELLNITFETLQPSGDTIESDIKHSVIAFSNNCLCFNTTDGKIIIDTSTTAIRELRKDSDNIINFENLLIIHPNPVEAEKVNIEFIVKSAAHTEINIYNEMGICVSTPVSKRMEAGKYNYLLNLNNFSSGCYFIVLQTKHGIISDKFIIVK